MRTLKIATSAIFATALVGMMVSGASAAKPAKHPKVISGTLSSYTAGQSAVITTSTGDVTVGLGKHVKLVDESTPAADPAAGDAAAAFVDWHKGAARAHKLEYGSAAFGIAHRDFPGIYSSSTGDCSAGSITISGRGKKRAAKSWTFSTDATTAYKQGSKTVACPASFGTGERLNIRGVEMTDSTWYAALVHLNTR